MKLTAPKLTLKNVAIGVLVVAVIILSFKRCGDSPTEAAKELKGVSDEQYKKAQDSISILKNTFNIAKRGLVSANESIMRLSGENNRLIGKLQQSNNRANHYAEEYEKAKADSNIAKAFENCDSMKIENQADKWVIGNLQTQFQQQEEQQRNKDSINDVLLRNQEAQTSIALQCCNVQKGLVDKMYKENRPRNSIWLGAEGAWSMLETISFVGLTGALQTKNGKQYEIGGGKLATPKDWYIKGGVKFKFSFRK